MSKHTPGPWAYDTCYRHGYVVWSSEHECVVDAQDDEGRYGAILSEPNARLIAAAPEMLEALQDLAAYADVCELLLMDGGYSGKAQSLRRRVTKAMSAIAKATGETV